MSELDFEQLFSCLCERMKVANKVQEISKQFAGLKEDRERVEIAYKHLSDFDLLPFKKESHLKSTKSAAQSVALRNAGNKQFGKKVPNIQDALRLYTQSIAAAPYPTEEADKSEELALAFANRSAVFFAMGKYEACQTDIDYALEFSYPDALKYKLLERRAKCLKEMGKCKEASKCFLNALAALSLSSLSDDKLKDKVFELEQQEKLSSAAVATSQVHIPEVTDWPLPNKTYGPHHEVPCACDCVEIKYSKEMGRYVVATRDINPGDVILIEKPFASVVQPHYFSTHCCHCLRRCATLIPCRQCCLILFCSDKCRTASWDKSHQLECCLLPALCKLDMGKIWILALRIIVVNFIKTKSIRGLYNLVNDIENVSSDERTKGFSPNGQYVSSDYRTIHYLVGNTEARSVSDLYKRSVKAACILNCIDSYSEMFHVNSLSAEIESANAFNNQADLKYFVGGLILRLLQSLPCNAHSLTDLVFTPGDPIPRSSDFGSAAYATLSLINHSCDPNVSRCSHCGDVGILFAVRPIKKGEQIMDNYGFHYALQDVQERLTGLKTQYYFTCRCEACIEDWPLYKNLPDSNPVLMCSNCGSPLPQQLSNKLASSVVCSKCSMKVDLLELEKRLQKISESFIKIYEQLISGSSIDFVCELSSDLLVLDQIVRRPWKLFNDVQESLKECLMRQGNFYKS